MRDGDRLRITSAAGAVEAQAVLDPTVRPGLIGMPRGQGHSEYGRYAQGRGTNPLDLVGRGFVDDTSAPAWVDWGLPNAWFRRDSTSPPPPGIYS